ncbi:lipid A-modifier LpxR family protein [Rhodalgimonas zhirmunskyi]|uniref:Lipid A deacylase LpxR family protein n=1 Tax=Rhodalgimonas zhirmunskyi TaxID=2964767 RepID=A0AAJ1U629_9RHOB|nr:lipid A-modifier LpxR family protein [Rhodoalgimonas zhirmunskyi]MDQ2093800.1 lipid A deacylase LpxR family protein [Rhodoalgimonas zhirmunskyi]
MRKLSCVRAMLFAPILAVLAAQASAEPPSSYRYLGYGRLISNDLFGDRQDRWRTASFVSSRLFGTEWTGQPPARLGQLLEFRLGAEIIAPRYINAPAWAIDRPYATSESLGLHSHARRGGVDIAAGLNAVITGPQTGLERVQRAAHEAAGIAPASAAVKASQIGNGFYGQLVLEAGRPIALGPQAELRPFVEAQAGVETLVRAGVDLSFGRLGGAGELLIRDGVTGQRYRTLGQQGKSGLGFVLGGDIAHVEDSIYLPGALLRQDRTRLRAGLHFQNKSGYAGFYGVTWLGPEAQGQGEGQLVGSLRIKLNF